MSIIESSIRQTKEATSAGSSTVARRIVMRRETWERLMHVAEALESTRGMEISAIDVAVVALEAGLEEVARGLSGVKPSKSSVQARRANSSSKSRSGSGKRRRPLRLSDDDRAQLEALLVGCRSTRARQRTLAFWLGHSRRTINTEHLRQLAGDYDAYNVANFAQNMKKDSAFFKERTSREGKRTGWKLTRQGSRKAKEVMAATLATA
jgi:hypothetical protein